MRNYAESYKEDLEELRDKLEELNDKINELCYDYRDDNEGDEDVYWCINNAVNYVDTAIVELGEAINELNNDKE